MKIRVFKLEGCGFCQDLVKLLKKEKIPFTPVEVTDSNNREQVDKLEQFFENSSYPKLILEVGFSKTIFINPNTGKGPNLTQLGDSYFEYYSSIQDILDIIKKHKNEIQTFG